MLDSKIQQLLLSLVHIVNRTTIFSDSHGVFFFP